MTTLSKSISSFFFPLLILFCSSTLLLNWENTREFWDLHCRHCRSSPADMKLIPTWETSAEKPSTSLRPPSCLQNPLPGWGGNITYLSQAMVMRMSVAAALWEAWTSSSSPFLVFLHFLLYRYNLLLSLYFSRTRMWCWSIDELWRTSHLHMCTHLMGLLQNSPRPLLTHFPLHTPLLRCKVASLHIKSIKLVTKYN